MPTKCRPCSAQRLLAAAGVGKCALPPSMMMSPSSSSGASSSMTASVAAPALHHDDDRARPLERGDELLEARRADEVALVAELARPARSSGRWSGCAPPRCGRAGRSCGPGCGPSRPGRSRRWWRCPRGPRCRWRWCRTTSCPHPSTARQVRPGSWPSPPRSGGGRIAAGQPGWPRSWPPPAAFGADSPVSSSSSGSAGQRVLLRLQVLGQLVVGDHPAGVLLLVGARCRSWTRSRCWTRSWAASYPLRYAGKRRRTGRERDSGPDPEVEATALIHPISAREGAAPRAKSSGRASWWSARSLGGIITESMR